MVKENHFTPVIANVENWTLCNTFIWQEKQAHRSITQRNIKVAVSSDQTRFNWNGFCGKDGILQKWNCIIRNTSLKKQQ